MSEASSPSPSRWIRLRLLLVSLIVCLLLGLIVRRAYTLQAVEGPRLREMAEQQYLKELELPPRRGTITDRHGIPLAVSVDVDSVWANPRVVGSRAAEVARQLSEALELDPWALQKQLSGRRYFVWIKRRIGASQANRVRALKIRGVHLTKESQRYYPNHGLGGNLVGFSGADAKGLEGVEYSFDGWLRGKPQRIAGLRDALGRMVFSEGGPGSSLDESASGRSAKGEDSQPGEAAPHDVQLALDKFIQFESEQAVAELQGQIQPETGWVAAVVLDPHNGDVLAAVSAPSYDPNHYQKAKPRQWRNRTIADAFEPGSTMKVFSIGAALDQGAVRPGDLFDCERGRWRVGHYTIHDSHPQKQLDVVGIIKKSSNIGAAKIAFLLGKQALHRSYQRFGFGDRTGVRLPGERSGALRPPNRWSDVALANIAFGQGLTTTVLQLAQGFGALANRGVMMHPRVVLKVRSQRGETVKQFAPSGDRAISAGTAERLLNMMRTVVEPGGTGEDAALDRYTVAGKTGTAQKVDPVTRRYATDRWVSSFVGVVPASRPRLVIAVVVNEPSGEKHYGGEVAGPVFRRIAERSLAYLGVKPDRPAPDPRPRRTAPAASPEREGFVAEESAPPLPGEGGPGGEVLVPDFTGMSLAEALDAARRSALKVEIQGSGRAVAQSPGPGPAPRQTTCRVSFRPPG